MGPWPTSSSQPPSCPRPEEGPGRRRRGGERPPRLSAESPGSLAVHGIKREVLFDQRLRHPSNRKMPLLKREPVLSGATKASSSARRDSFESSFRSACSERVSALSSTARPWLPLPRASRGLDAPRAGPLSRPAPGRGEMHRTLFRCVYRRGRSLPTSEANEESSDPEMSGPATNRTKST